MHFIGITLETVWLVFVIVQLMAFCSVTGKMRIVDLSHEENEDVITWPTNPPFNLTVLYRGPFLDDMWLENNYFGQPEHAGTHVDSPAHLHKGSWRTSQIPMENLYGPGVIIDVKSKAAANPDYQVTIDDLLAWESKHGEIPDGAVVIMNSGWFYHYPNKSAVFNTTTPGDPDTFHFPGWHETATEWLVNNRHIHILGVDTPSNDYGQSKNYPSHVIIAKENIPGVENVAYLDKIPENGSTIFVPVLKLYDGSGGPARMFATYDDEIDKKNPNNGPRLVSSLVYWYIILTVAYMAL